MPVSSHASARVLRSPSEVLPRPSGRATRAGRRGKSGGLSVVSEIAAPPSSDFLARLAELAKLPAVLEELRGEVDALRAELARLKVAGERDDLLDVNAAARLLGMTPAALRQAVYRRTMPALRVGRRLRFRRDDLLAQAA